MSKLWEVIPLSMTWLLLSSLVLATRLQDRSVDRGVTFPNLRSDPAASSAKRGCTSIITSTSHKRLGWVAKALTNFPFNYRCNLAVCRTCVTTNSVRSYYDLARHESPSSSVVRAPGRCTGGHEFDSCRGVRFFLCPTLVTNWIFHLSQGGVLLPSVRWLASLAECFAFFPTAEPVYRLFIVVLVVLMRFATLLNICRATSLNTAKPFCVILSFFLSRKPVVVEH